MNLKKLSSIGTNEELKSTAREIKALDEMSRHRQDEKTLELCETLLSGKVVIDLEETIIAGGLNDKGFPNLAFGPANEIEVFCSMFGSTMLFRNFSSDVWLRMDSLDFSRKWSLREMALFNVDRLSKTTVPYIPPSVRKDKKIDDMFILFEVSSWERVRIPDPIPEIRTVIVVDPVLLSPIGGKYYAVEAIWDMTELEALATGL